jgi:hypothetical protein
MIGAYQAVVDFAYPGWRLTVPGGPAGGHYKGFTHSEATGTTILPQDDYETDRGDGMSSHDAVHASQRNPRGVYRSSAEVPPRPNASGSAQTYRSFQTKRHAGTSVAPGSFPADFHETGEDDFLSLAENAPHYFTPGDVAGSLLGLGVAFESVVGAGPVNATGSEMVRYPYGGGGRLCPSWGCGPMPGPIPVWKPNTVTAPAAPVTPPPPPSTGATSTVNQPPATPAPAPPSPAVPVYTAPPVSPAPAPTVATNEVVPLNDGSGNYVNISTGTIVTPSQVQQNLATMQLTTASAVTGQLIPAADGSGNFVNPQTGAVIPAAAISQSAAATPLSTGGIMTWLQAPSAISPSIPNWGLVAAAAVGAAMLMGKRR